MQAAFPLSLFAIVVMQAAVASTAEGRRFVPGASHGQDTGYVASQSVVHSTSSLEVDSLSTLVR